MASPFPPIYIHLSIQNLIDSICQLDSIPLTSIELQLLALNLLDTAKSNQLSALRIILLLVNSSAPEYVLVLLTVVDITFEVI
jgi:hypothetical protein